MLQPGPLPLLSTQGKANYRTAPNPTTNVGENNLVNPKATLVLNTVIFHQDNTGLSPDTPTDNVGGTSPLDGTSKTATPQSAIPTSIRGRKSNSNHTWPTDVIGAESKIDADREIDVMLEASSGVSNDNSDYYESINNSPTSSYNHPELAE